MKQHLIKKQFELDQLKCTPKKFKVDIKWGEGDIFGGGGLKSRQIYIDL